MAERASFLAGLDIGGGGGRCLLVHPASGEIRIRKEITIRSPSFGSMGLRS